MADLLRNTFFSVAILSLFSLPAHGKDVTAPPLPSVSSLSQSGRLITITKAMIDESAANSLAEMLSQFVGIYAYHRGGNGQPVITNVRGNRSGDVLFLLNDVSIQSAISSTSAIHRIPLEIIDRIEIAYGPNSALYGSSALAAVIKIYTNLPNEERLHTDLLIGAGSESTYKLKASLNGKIRKTQIGIEVLQHKTDGINSYLSDMWPDSDGTTYGTVGFSLTNQLSKKLKIGVQGLYINGTREFDYQFPETEEESIDEQWSIRAEYKYRSDWDMFFSAGHYLDQITDYTSGIQYTENKTRNRTFKWSNRILLGENHILFGGLDFCELYINFNDYQTLASSDSMNKTNLSDIAGFIKWEYQSGAFGYELAIRRHTVENSGSHTTGDIGFSWDFYPGYRFYSRYSEAYKLPSILEIYSAIGNPSLLPEKTRSVETGIAGRYESIKWTLALFENETRDLIVSPEIVYQNSGKYRSKGAEFEIQTAIGNWGFSANSTLLKSKDSETGEEPGYQPNLLANLNIEYDFRWFKTGINANYVGDRYNSDRSQVLSNYTLVNSWFRYDYNRDLWFRLKASNLLDEDYQTRLNYYSPPFGYFLTMHYRID